MRHIQIFLVFVLLCGCGKKIVTVTGEVLYEGSPAKDVVLLFEPRSGATQVAESGVAVTGADGRFKLESSSGKRGIEPGTYTVYLGWINPDTVVVDDAGPSPDTPPPSPPPYQFPVNSNNEKVVVDVQINGKRHFVFKFTPEEILAE